MDELPVLVRDTREKDGKGWNWRASKNCAGVVEEKLDVGDYSVKGLEHLICVERKTIGDLWGTLANQTNYKRFLKEWDRAVKHRIKYLVIEGNVSDVDAGYPWSKVSPENIHAKLISLQVKYNVHVIFAGRQDTARSYVRRLLCKLHRYYVEGILVPNGPT